MTARTAEQAVRNACRQYEQMLKHANGGFQALAGADAAKFANAAYMAQTIELDEIRQEQHRTNELLAQVLAALSTSDDDRDEAYRHAPLPPNVDGYAVGGAR